MQQLQTQEPDAPSSEGMGTNSLGGAGIKRLYCIEMRSAKEGEKLCTGGKY